MFERTSTNAPTDLGAAVPDILKRFVACSAHQTGHRKARAKTRNTSRLEQIPGIGAKKRQLLLNKFGGLQGVQSAGIEELMVIKGINRETAQVIYDTFNG